MSMTLIQLARVKGGISATEPAETVSHMNPGDTRLLSFMNDAAALGLIFCPAAISECSIYNNDVSMASPLQYKFMYYTGVIDLTGAANPSVKVDGQSIYLTPTENSYAWWHAYTADEVTYYYRWSGATNNAIAQAHYLAPISAIDANTTTSATRYIAWIQQFAVVFGALAIAFWNQNLELVQALMDELMGMLGQSLKPAEVNVLLQDQIGRITQTGSPI